MRKVKPLFILSISMFFISSVYAATSYLYSSSEISYDNSKSKLTKTNLTEALEELYTKCNTPATKCPDGYTCDAPICKRVTESSSLLTETCSQSRSYCAEVEGYNNTITYGKAKELGTPLEPGDAFDCKVSTSGGYTERFYYVSDYYDTTTQTFNSDVGVLIYYTNTINGSPSNSGAAYDSNNTNYNGPVTAVTHMPTTTQWNNISLYKTNRQILAQNNATSTSGGTLPIAFSYSGKAARLLTYQEVNQACYNTTTDITSTGGLNNCNFLFENTQYSKSANATTGPWLETPNSSYDKRVYYANSRARDVSSSRANDTAYGARPVIEVPKNRLYIGKYGLITENGNLYYYLNEQKQVGWLKVNGDYYLFDSETKAAKKNYWYQFNGRWYYFADDGKMALGEKEIDGSWYYFYKPAPYSDNYIGQMAYNEFIGDGNVDYWYGSDGKKDTTKTYIWKQSSDGWWYEGSDGWRPQNASYWINGKQETFNSQGYLQ